MKNRVMCEANLLRIKACLYLIKNKYYEANDCFLKSWNLYAMHGCGLGAASCESAIGYLRLLEEEYAPAKKHISNALKYYDQIAHHFGKYYLNQWLCSLKTKMNKA
jgi:tetratricopeptide (TPR) repeat protein